jgi:hypothetical protein
MRCRRGDLNPHERNAHCALNAARLPIPPLRLSEVFYFIHDDCQRAIADGVHSVLGGAASM